jgi:hypothetical protein
MKKLLILLFIPSLLFGQRTITDSVYLKPTQSSAGKWLSSKTDLGGASLKRIDTINRKKVATRKMVDSLIGLATTGKISFIGSCDASGNTWPSTGLGGGAIKKGDWWAITTGGTLGGVTVTTDNQIYALSDAPGQTASNWDIIGSTTIIPIGRTSGDVGSGFLIYSGATRTPGNLYGNTQYNYPTNTIKQLSFDGNFIATSLYAGLQSGMAVGSYKLYSYSDENNEQVRFNNTGSGTSHATLSVNANSNIGQLINLGSSNTTKFLSGYTGSSEKWNINYTGKGTFNGGILSTGVPLDSSYINFKGYGNVNLGESAGRLTLSSKNFNTNLGFNAGKSNKYGEYNTYIGSYVFGYKSRSHMLMIDSYADTITPFIAGNTTNGIDTLRINARTRIGVGLNYAEFNNGAITGQSTTYNAGYFTSTGAVSLYVNNGASNLNHIADFALNGTNKASINSDGLGTFNGGLVSLGNVYLSNLGTAGSGTTLVIDGSNKVIPLSSSRRFKYDISKFKINSAKIFDLVPYQYKYKESKVEEFGYMAEDVYKILPELVNLDKEGNPYSLKDYRFVILLTEEVKKQKKQIDDLTKRIEKLEKK